VAEVVWVVDIVPRQAWGILMIKALKKAWCQCPSCRELTPSDQSLIFANALAESLKSINDRAQVPYLAYSNALLPARQVKPAEGVFLQYAPIQRCFEHSIGDGSCKTNQPCIEALDRLTECFNSDEAEILEYWLDASLFSKYKKPTVKLPFTERILKEDISFYAKKGIKRISTFGVWLDAEYVSNHGLPPIASYGKQLKAL